MHGKALLMVDAIINLALGVLLLIFPRAVVVALGLPESDSAFYPSILGAVLLGIGVALILECIRPATGVAGLGLGGAISINMVGGLVLAAWLFFGDLSLPIRGVVVLWCLVAVLVVLSCVELIAQRRCSSRVAGNA